MSNPPPLTPASPGPILARVGLFAGFGEEVWTDMETRSRRIAIPKGATVFEAGDTTDEVFVLASGSLEVSVNRSGRRIVLATLKEFDYFGEMAMLTAEPRSATVTATEDSVVIEMGRQLLSEIFRSHPGLMDHAVKNIAARKRANTPVIEEDAKAHEFTGALRKHPAGLLDRLKQMLHLGE